MGEKVAKLSAQAQLYVVGALARYERNEDIVKALKELYEVDITNHAITYYNPVSLAKQGKTLKAELQEHFNKCRKEFLEAVQTVPSSSQVFRLQQLDEMAQVAKDKKNYKLAASLYEQAAKEMGGFYTDKIKHELSGSVEVGVTTTALAKSLLIELQKKEE